jgi:DNA-binding response OmpR family regulator
MDEQPSARESSLNPQPWPWFGPRVLIEDADVDRADALVAVLRHAGFAVAVCPGPLPHDRCPLAGEDGCVAAEGADVIVSGLGLQTAEARETLAALRTRLPRKPLLVQATAHEAAQWPELVRGCELVETPVPPERLLERVRAVLEREADSGA